MTELSLYVHKAGLKHYSLIINNNNNNNNNNNKLELVSRQASVTLS